MFQISTTQTQDISLSCVKALCIYTPHNTCCETRTKRKKSNTFSPLLNVVFDAKEKKDKKDKKGKKGKGKGKGGDEVRRVTT